MIDMIPVLLGMPGPVELGIILVIVLLIFGASRLPKIFKSMGSGIHEFKKGLKEGDTEESGKSDKKDS